MKSLIKFRGNCIKCFGFALLFGFISLGAIGGCSNSGGDNNNAQALTENDFAEDSSLSARADRGVVVHFLEPPGGGQTDQGDTGGVGDDVIPLRYNQTFEHTICWEDDDEAAAHFMTLVDSEGQEVLSVEANGDCVTEIIERGSYEMHLHHDGLSEDTHPIFIQPLNGGPEAKNTSGEYGIYKTAKRIIEETLQSFGITTEARAQTVQQNIETLLKTRSCVNCNLEKAKLFMVDLTGADLTGANLSMANMNASTLTNSILTGTTMTDSTLIGSILMGADLSTADLTGASLLGADLIGADLTKSDLTGADLSNAYMTDAILSGATLTGTDLTKAKLNTATLSIANLQRAKLFEADLTGANLTGANITQVNLNASTLTDANLTDADLTDTTLIASVLMGANLMGADLTGANLLGADLIDVNLTDVTLGSTTFDNARWCDGSCTCGANSIDACVGCASIDICTGS